tara:strand:- start:786 stop:1223 length:438 start_codon:yes stop_codon:yes gene_type:complete
MSSLFDDLKETVKEWTTVAVEKAEEVGKIAVAKTEEVTRISKIKLEVHQHERDLAKLYEQLGRFVCDHAKEDNMVNFTGNSEFFNLVQKVDQLQSLTDGKKEDIERVKDEYKLDDSDITTVDDVVEEKVENSPTSEIKDEHSSDE